MSYLDNDIGTLGAPWALARARVDQMTAFAENDGWNADGAMANECKFSGFEITCSTLIGRSASHFPCSSLQYIDNKMPFSDFKLEEYLGYTQFKYKGEK